MFISRFLSTRDHCITGNIEEYFKLRPLHKCISKKEFLKYCIHFLIDVKLFNKPYKSHVLVQKYMTFFQLFSLKSFLFFFLPIFRTEKLGFQITHIHDFIYLFILDSFPLFFQRLIIEEFIEEQKKLKRVMTYDRVYNENGINTIFMGALPNTIFR